MAWIHRYTASGTDALNYRLSSFPYYPQALYMLKSMLVQAGWTVKNSADSTTYIANTDRWTSVNAVANQAWVRMQDPAGVREYLFQVNSGSGGAAKVVYSAAAKFTGGAPGVGNLPTATDEQFLTGSTGAGVTGMGQLWGGVGNIAVQHRFQMGAMTTAPYSFYCLGFTTIYSALIRFDGIIGDGMLPGTYPASDQDPWVTFVANGGNSFTVSEIGPSSPSASGSPRGWYKYGLGGVTWTTFPGMTYIISGGAIQAPGQSTTGGIGLGSQYDGENVLLPLVYARHSGLAQPGYKGVSTVFKVPTVHSSPGNYIDVGSERYLFVGSYVVPYANNVVPVTF